MSRAERRRQEKIKRKKNVKTFIRDILIAMLVSLGILTCVAPSKVKERSMQPTINDGDIVILNKLFYRNIERGDIVVFESELKDENGKALNLIKRVVALEGDRVDIKEEKLFINGKAIDEKYVFSSPSGKISENFLPKNYVVPKGEVYVLGDHREVSRDSRQLGAIKKDKIVGNAIFRVYPFNNIGVLD